MRSSILKAAALATVIAQATLANPDEPAAWSRDIQSIATHIDPESELFFDVFYFQGFLCGTPPTDNHLGRLNPCRGLALTITHDAPEPEPTILWTRMPVMRSIPGVWGPMNYRLAAVHWDPEEQLVWLASALTTDAVTFIEVQQLFVQRCPETGSFRITEHGLSAHTLSHEENQLPRVSKISIEPTPDAGVHVITHHENDATTNIAFSTLEKRRAIGSDHRRGFEGMYKHVEGLKPAIHQAIRERQSPTTPSDPAQPSPPLPESP